jgi:murein DD-endopeptidase MepM/ murein hydrolase activator NlpD
MIANRTTTAREVLAVVGLCAAFHAAADEDILALGQGYTQQFFDGELDTIWAQMTPEMQDTIGSKEALGAFRRRIEAEAGVEQQVVREAVTQQAGARTYMRYGRFEKMATPVAVSWSFDGEGRIAGFFVRPLQKAADSPYLDYRTKASLRLPFDGEWYVFWGGREVEQNYHAAARDQRFAYDFVGTQNGVSHRGDGTANEDYYCWGRRVLSPAEAEVIAVERLLPDNPPGVMDPENPAGNHVMLDFGDSEYALLAHLMADTIEVEVGDTLSPGQLIGRCGNSGNTSEPHLHFHLQDEPGLGEGDGLPARFSHYLADGEYVARGEPVQGQTIAPATERTAGDGER